jgi:putative ABC transport system permease protein
VFGLAPALEGSRLNLNAVLTEGAGRGSPTRRGRLLRDLLVGGEIAMAMVLLISNALLVKSLTRIWNTDVGFQADHLLTVDVALPPKAYQDLPKAQRTLDDIGERIRALPGVQLSSAAEHVPFGNSSSQVDFWIDGQPAPLPGDVPSARIAGVTPGYFLAMGIPFRGGRDFTAADDEHAPRVVLVNETFAKREWPNQDPLGRRIRIGQKDAVTAEVIGIVKMVRMFGFESEPERQMYVPMKQRPQRRAYFAIRSQRDPIELGNALRSAVWSLDPNIPVPEMSAMPTAIAEAYTPHRMTTQWMTVFSALALVLSAVGLYAMMARTVAQRSREIGIRMALGAQTADILGVVLRRGAMVTAIGAAIGLAGATAITQSLSLILYEVSARDPVMYMSVAAVLMLVALMACYLPARRAAKLDPAMALRHD